MTNTAASNPLFHTSSGALCHTCRHAHIPMSMCAHTNIHHTCRMHNRTQSLRAMLHSSNRPANLSQGVSACNCVRVWMWMCVRSGNVTERRGASWREQKSEQRERERRGEADRPGERDGERKNQRGRKRTWMKTHWGWKQRRSVRWHG